MLDSDSIYLFSYPKSGRTYLRFMVGKYFQLKHNLEEYDILKYSRFARGYNCTYNLYFTHAGSYENEDEIHYQKIQGLENKIGINGKTLFLKRNKYDTIVSFYHHARYRKKQFHGTISQFIKSDIGIKGLLDFEKFVKNLNHELVIDYEDLCETPEVFLEKILNLMGAKIDKQVIYQAVDESTFDKMREAEMSGRVPLSDKSYIDKSDERQLKVRRGIIGGYKDYLSEKDIEYIDEKFYNNN